MTVVAYFSLDNVHNNHNLKRTSDTNVIGHYVITCSKKLQAHCCG